MRTQTLLRVDSASAITASPMEWSPTIRKGDNLLNPDSQQRVYDFLNQSGWKFGWKSNRNRNRGLLWHKHFAGALRTDHDSGEECLRSIDCSEELYTNAPLIHEFWCGLTQGILKNHMLVRCYANALSYGIDGLLHTDSISPRSFTTIYYPNKVWKPDWGGETVFFNTEKTDIITSIYPMPNRLVTFSGALPHAARGLSRNCSALRITLMFKTEIRDD